MRACRVVLPRCYGDGLWEAVAELLLIVLLWVLVQFRTSKTRKANPCLKKAIFF